MTIQEARLAIAIGCWTHNQNQAPRSVDDRTQGRSYRDSGAKLISGKLNFRAEGHLVEAQISSSSFEVDFDSDRRQIEVRVQGSQNYRVEDTYNNHQYNVIVRSSRVELIDLGTKEVLQYELY